jgi:hypothetical protein
MKSASAFSSHAPNIQRADSVTGEQTESKLSPDKREQIKSLLLDLPEAFQDRLSAVKAVRDTFHEEAVAAMTAPLNEHFAPLPQDTGKEKSETASYINGTLRSIGLTIRCPKTSLPATLVADFQDGAHQDISRFRLEVRDEQGKKIRTFSGRYLPELSFMQDHQRREFWRKRAGRGDRQV